MRLQNKTALVTGAARGIGQAICVYLARAGAHIMGLDLDSEAMEKTEELVRREGREFRAFVGDLTHEKEMQRLIDEIFPIYGGFDVLVNNAGVVATGPFIEQDPWTIRKVLEIDLIAMVMFTRYALPYMLKRKEGHIVNIASIAGKLGTEGLVAYGAAKHGVVGFSSALREELRDRGIGVSWICPSFVKTRLISRIRRTVMTPLLEPADVARAVVKAVEKNKIEVIVPSHMRFTVAILPNVLPRFARNILKWTGASRGWYAVKRDTIVSLEKKR